MRPWRFLHYWTFVRGEHRSSENSLPKGQYLGMLLLLAWAGCWTNSQWDAMTLMRCHCKDKVGCAQQSVSQIPCARDCINNSHMVKEIYVTPVGTPEAWFSQTTILWITADYSAGSYKHQGHKDKGRTEIDVERRNTADQRSFKTINLKVDHYTQDKWLIYSTKHHKNCMPRMIIYCTWPHFVSWCPILAECRLRFTGKLGKLNLSRMCKVCHTSSLFHMPSCEHPDHRFWRIWWWLKYSRVGPGSYYEIFQLNWLQVNSTRPHLWQVFFRYMLLQNCQLTKPAFGIYVIYMVHITNDLTCQIQVQRGWNKASIKNNWKHIIISYFIAY